MKITSKIITLETKERLSIINITGHVKGFLSASKLANGFINVFVRHTTAGIMINEEESGLLRDMKNFLEAAPPGTRDYHHNIVDGCKNVDSHLKAMALNKSESIPVVGGVIQLGTWQSILFVELDGPRQREVVLQAAGE